MTTPGPTCHELAAYLDELLRVDEIRDWENALNGLQVENRVPIRRVAAAVDASEATIRGAIAQACQILIVHHGLFWAGNRAVTGRRYRRLRLLFDAELAVYGSHLPLDVHPDLGNNVRLARLLGIEPEAGFGSHEGRDIGVHGPCDIDRDEMHRMLEEVLGGSVRMIAGGPQRIRRAGILTGSGGGAVDDALSAGLDALITGEGTHHTFVDAMEGGLNLFYGGHYATETWGVRALAEHVAEHFGLEWTFIDAPTGM